MSRASEARRARLDALLDHGGLDAAPASERAWLEAERARDPEFDTEVRVLLGVEASLRAWGSGGAGHDAEASADAALVGIFAGIDAGLYDDDLDVTAPPRFDDGEQAVVALPLAPRAASAQRARVVQGLAAAAAVVLVVTAGVSVSRLSSPEASEAGVAMQAEAAPSAGAAPSTLAPPAPAAPVPVADALLQPLAPAQGYGGRDELDALAEAEAAPEAADRAPGAGQGVGARASYEGAASSRARPATGSAAPAPAPASAGRVMDLMGPSGTTRATSESLAVPADLAPAEAPAVSARRPSTGTESTATGGAAPSDDVSTRVHYGSLSEVQLALARCLSAEREVTYEVGSGSGALRIVAAPGASSAELQCLRRVAQRGVLDPAPGVTRRQRVTLRPSATVSDPSAR